MKRLIALFVMFTMSACGNVLSETRHVGGHAFAVPRSHLLNQFTPWFLPRTEDSLLFVLNPENEISEHNNVVLDPAWRMCRDGLVPALNRTARACGNLTLVSPSSTPFPLAKLHKVIGDVGWIYVISDQYGDHEIASCIEIGPTKAYPGDKRGGLCNALGGYQDLVFQIGFREAKLPQLPILIGDVQKILSKWEAAVKD